MFISDIDSTQIYFNLLNFVAKYLSNMPNLNKIADCEILFIVYLNVCFIYILEILIVNTSTIYYLCLSFIFVFLLSIRPCLFLKYIDILFLFICVYWSPAQFHIT